MTPPSELACVRGCVDAGRHFAECESFGVDAAGGCTGCVPSRSYKTTCVCEACYLRVRGILRNAPDLVGRLRSLVEQGKAAAYSAAKVSGAAAHAPQQIDAELLDALTEIERNLAAWYRHFDPSSLAGIDQVLSIPEWVDSLWDATLEVHLVDENGDRQAWSLADAAARWGIERRERHVAPWLATEEPHVIARMPVTEWYDPLLTVKQAADRTGKTQRIVQKWIEKGDLQVAMRVRQPDGSVIRAVRASAVDTVNARKRRGRPRAGTADTPLDN